MIDTLRAVTSIAQEDAVKMVVFDLHRLKRIPIAIERPSGPSLFRRASIVPLAPTDRERGSSVVGMLRLLLVCRVLV